MNDFDILIVGAGPAGSTAARLLAPHYRVGLLEKDAEGGRKCCGGLLAPDAQRVLAEMGLALPGETLDGAQPFSVRVIDVDNDLCRYFQRFYVNVDRARFDAFLLSLVPQTAEVMHETRFVSARRCAEGWRVETRKKDGSTQEISCAFLVGADGALSKVRRAVAGEERMPQRYASAQRHFLRIEDEAHFTAVFDQKISDYYQWCIPKSDREILGVAVEEGKSAHAALDRLKIILEEKGHRFGEEIESEGTVILRPHRAKGVCTGGEGFALLGEAASFISPSSAEGISYALRSARYLARALADGQECATERYHKLCVALQQNLYGKTMKCLVMYQKKLRGLVLRSGFLSIPVQDEA